MSRLGVPGNAGPKALAALLFGKENRWGKLPITIYDKHYATAGPKIQNMEYDAETAAPGRSYRYYTGKPLFAFGSGLSLTTFTHTCSCAKHAQQPAAAAAAADISCECTVKNTGALAGDEVVMVYDALSAGVRAAVGKAHPVPLKRLVEFDRVAVAGGGSATVKFAIPKEVRQRKAGREAAECAADRTIS